MWEQGDMILNASVGGIRHLQTRDAISVSLKINFLHRDTYVWDIHQKFFVSILNATKKNTYEQINVNTKQNAAKNRNVESDFVCFCSFHKVLVNNKL